MPTDATDVDDDRPRRRRVRERRRPICTRSAPPWPARKRTWPSAPRRSSASARSSSRPRPPSTTPSGCRPPSTRSSARWRRPCRPTFSTSSSRSGRPSAPSRTPSGPTLEHDRRARGEHDKVTAADRDVLNERQSLADAVGQLFDQATAFGEFARPDLRPLLERGHRARLARPGRLAGRPASGRGTRRPASSTARTPTPRPGRGGRRARSRPPSPRSSTRSPPRPEAAARSPRGR